MACKVSIQSPDVDKELIHFVKGDLYCYVGGVAMCNEDTFIDDSHDSDHVDFTVIYVNPRVDDLKIGELVCEPYTKFRRFTGTLTLSQEG
jgi:hypothetical protein